MTPEVEGAIGEIKEAFRGHKVEVTEEAQGGAYVIVYDLPLGERYEPASTWCGFLIPFQYPHADVYPHFIDAAVKRTDGSPLGTGFQGSQVWRERAVIQVSRRSNRWDAGADTAAAKLAKVITWIQTQ